MILNSDNFRYFREVIRFLFCILLLIPNFVRAQEENNQPDPSSFKDPFSEPTPENSAAPNLPPTEPPTAPETLVPPSTQSEAPKLPPPPKDFDAPVEQVPVEEPRDFQVPVIEKDDVPVTQDIVESEKFRVSRTNRWNLMSGLGAAMNLNRRYQQFHVEASGGYRWDDHWEFAGLLSYRTVKDQLIGMIGLVRWAYAFDLMGLRAEVLPHLGMGWSIRMKPSGTKFSEGRFTTRVGSDLLFYAMPDFAVATGLSLESFLFLMSNDTGSESLLKNGGPPSQLILSVGTRWMF